jgi:hypothetical protein
MAPILSFLISYGSKKKEPRYVCLSEAKTSHSHTMWTEVSSSVPHFLQIGLLLSPITYKCLLKVLCPVSRPITTLDCVLLRPIHTWHAVPMPFPSRSSAMQCVNSNVPCRAHALLRQCRVLRESPRGSRKYPNC